VPVSKRTATVVSSIERRRSFSVFNEAPDRAATSLTFLLDESVYLYCKGVERRGSA